MKRQWLVNVALKISLLTSLLDRRKLNFSLYAALFLTCCPCCQLPVLLQLPLYSLPYRYTNICILIYKVTDLGGAILAKMSYAILGLDLPR